MTIRASRTVKPFSTMTAAEFQRLALERDIQSGVIHLLTLLHIPHSVTDASRTWSKDGEVRRGKVDTDWPDVSGTLPPTGRALYVETKARWGKLSPGQREKIKELRRAGALCIVPDNISDVAVELARAGFRHPVLLSLWRDRGHVSGNSRWAS
jgi:VRR-NUC domain-containing protein